MHNGLTAICSEIDIKENILSVKELNIVNGCQSLTTIYICSETVKTSNDGYIMFRFYEITGSDKADKISKSTNSQSAVKARDLRSNYRNVLAKKLVVIGNGFDLGHGLKTNFEDFIGTNSQVLNKKFADLKNGKNSWSEIETDYKSKLNTFISKLDILFLVDDEMSSIIDAYGLNKYGDVNYYGYNNGMFNSLINEIDRCATLLCDFEIEFAEYLRVLYNSEK